ncbi:MAG TPA: ATP-dependent RNA helicase HrpA [Kineosporiaceae bacterium]|nr:ATP-dependent RNA helicase HrpA [Kineosporiaceae bacterium]
MCSQPAAPAAPSVAELAARLGDVTIEDAHRIGRRLDGVRGLRDPHRRASTLRKLEREIDNGRLRLLERQAAAPVVRYPPELPVSQARDELLAVIRDHQVVIVAGETGSGKTTQLPKICLELGRGVRGMIGHTQPRRIAARTVAERIAQELDTELGKAVGYTVRFTDDVGPTTLVKLMTDGILLAEIQRDRLLARYDTIIIDEAHERSLNIDFLFGYLKQILPRRSDLKVIVTSATIDPERFARHFDDAPIVEVSGRTHPVEVRYRPLDPDVDGVGPADGQDDDLGPKDQIEGICDAVQELAAEGDGDVLVFLSGEREIRDTAEALRSSIQASRLLRGAEVLPLYARLSAAEQHRVFQPHTGRRIVLATNVAEASLTVPGIRYVVDPGTARISRYSYRTKVQRLPIEPISRASADQRKGRCGRVAEGICIRMYSEEDYLTRPEFTDPEILRTNLASVILQMSALGLGDVEAFPFVDPPDRRSVRDGVDLLHELGALDPAQPEPRRRLTPLGRRLARLPIDPRLGRMVLEADRQGCVREVMVVVAALSIQDPRERPVDHQQAADAAHARFADPTSDFLGWLRLWTHVHEQARELSSSAFRRLCRREFLNYLRIREWQDLVAQLRQLATSVDVTLNAGPCEDPVQIHTSLLAGLLSHIGVKEAAGDHRAGDPRGRGEYLGARGARFAIFPGSALYGRQPTWVMAAELVETSRLFARECARIEPGWVEPLAHHLVRRSYSDPHWEARRGSVVATEKVTLYGVPIVAARAVPYGGIDPELSRELFVRHALVEGDWRTGHTFFAENRALLEDVEDLENRARRRDILVDDETLFAFYDARIPAGVVSAAHFDRWWTRARREDPDLLTFTPDLLLAESRTRVDPDDYPDTWRQADLRLRLRYAFEPGSPADGVTVEIPLAVLNQVDADDFSWQVPGLRLELITQLIRTLPKQLRRLLVPAPDHARQALAQLRPGAAPLLDALERELGRQAGAPIPRDAWQLGRLPAYLRMTFRVLDAEGSILAEGKDLDALRRRLRPRQRHTLARAASALERGGLRAWPDHLPDGVLPRTFTRQVTTADGATQTVTGFPALVDEGEGIGVRVLATEADQRHAMTLGTRRLLLLNVASPARAVLARLDNASKLALASAPHPSPSALFDDCTAAAVDAIVTDAGGPAWTAPEFGELLATVRSRLDTEVMQVVRLVARVLSAAADVDRRLRGTTSPVLLPALTDVRTQVSHLVHPHFVADTGVARLPDVVRYLRAAAVRLDALPERPERDRQLMGRIEVVQQSCHDALAALPLGKEPSPELAGVRWMIEELRVSFFAQQLGTAYPVSEKRIQRVLAEHPH